MNIDHFYLTLKTDQNRCTFSAENETGAENVISFSAENETENERLFSLIIQLYYVNINSTVQFHAVLLLRWVACKEFKLW